MAEYIEREAALSLVRPDAPEDEKAAVTIATAKKLVRNIVRRTPAADVAPVVHGAWIDFYGDHKTAECSKCQQLFEVTFDGPGKPEFFAAFQDFYRYCPSCGARMDGDGDA